MKNLRIALPVIAGLFFLSACQQQQSDTPESSSQAASIDKKDAVASVNGAFISKAALEELKEDVAKRSGGQTFPDEQLLDELIKRELLLQEARQKKLAERPDVKKSLMTMQNSVMTQAAIQDYLNTNDVTEDELKAEYDKKIGSAKTEYKARHILLKTEEEAKNVIDKLNKGGDFEALAKELSTGPSNVNGGDLGWFVPQQMVPPFSEAVIALEDGKYTSEPVQTNFGWHVILREGSRTQEAPSFDSVKDQLKPMLQREKLQQYLTDLRNAAEIEVLIPLTEEQAEPEAAAETPASGEEDESGTVEESEEASEENALEPEEAGESETPVETAE